MTTRCWFVVLTAANFCSILLSLLPEHNELCPPLLPADGKEFRMKIISSSDLTKQNGMLRGKASGSYTWVQELGF